MILYIKADAQAYMAGGVTEYDVEADLSIRPEGTDPDLDNCKLKDVYRVNIFLHKNLTFVPIQNSLKCKTKYENVFYIMRLFVLLVCFLFCLLLESIVFPSLSLLLLSIFSGVVHLPKVWVT